MSDSGNKKDTEDILRVFEVVRDKMIGYENIRMEQDTTVYNGLLDNSMLQDEDGGDSMCDGLEEDEKNNLFVENVREIVLDTLRKVYYGELSPFSNTIPYVPEVNKGKRMDQTLLYEVQPHYIERLKNVFNEKFEGRTEHRVCADDFTYKLERRADGKEPKWLSERMGIDYWGWNNPGHPSFICTPTGTGKSTFVVGTLIVHALNLGYDISIYVPRETLAAQYLFDIEKVLQKEGFQNIRDILENKVIVDTFQSLEARLARNRKVRITDLTIIDECHSLLTDAIYNRNCTLSFNFFVNLNFASKLVFMSATGERIFDKLDKCIMRTWRNCGLPQEKFLSFWYSSTPDYSYLDIHYLPQNWNIVDLINTDKENKWIVFVDSIRAGEIYKSELRKAGINAPFLHSDSKRQEADTFNSITMLNRFSEPVVISSSTLESGINIKDVKLRNILIAGNNREQFLQMLGRKRAYGSERVNLYLDPKSKRHFEVMLRHVREMKKKYDAVTRPGRYNTVEALSQDVVDYYIGNRVDISVFFTSHSPGMLCNELCAEELNYLIATYGEIIDRFDTEGEGAFLKTQLDWLALPQEQYDTIRVDNEGSVLRNICDLLEGKIILLEGRGMLIEERKDFLKSLVPEVKRVTGGKDYITQGDILAVKKFNEFCEKKGIPYFMRTENTKPTSYYLGRREETEDEA